MRAKRPDKPYIEDLLRSSYTAGAVVLALLIANILLVVLLAIQIKSPRLIAVIDRGTGKTYATVSQGINSNLVERQLIYYSRQFIEDYFTMDYAEIEGARKRAYEIMHPKMQAKVGAAWLQDENVKMSQENATGTEWEWNLKPSVTMKNDPVYTVFAQATRIITRQGYKPIEEKFNVLLKWGRLEGGSEAFQRPHQLVLLEQEELSNDRTKLNEQINLSYK